MLKSSYKIIGVMSGTSLDGIDIAQINFELSNGHWTFKILVAETIPYSDVWHKRLRDGINLDSQNLQILDNDYTLLLGNEISSFIDRFEIKTIDAVSSHGHTILHRPNDGITRQIGNSSTLSRYVKNTVVCDFRVADVNLGGQGAPLVPIGDKLLFGENELCMNLGGFSNVSFDDGGKRVAFDICPVNIVLNFYANKLGYEFDNKGTIARNASVDSELLKRLNQIEFYKKPFPKSLGLEFVQSEIFPLIESFEISAEATLATFTEHIAIQTANSLKHKSGKMLMTGGGTFNEYLLERITFHLPNIKLIIPEKKTINYKEALIFGFLGVLRLRNEINVLSSVTGAKHDHSSGQVFQFP